ncbi:GAD-like domain-containing protein [Pseudomonas sp. PSKL.D1]|uniref:GAD-like domain-containing protein n=1 Tax=Pseudomonas sp. PSKL.D1 TaxID=3029060 RepID=UPI002380D568|nr:GAD-like domain-containing protein [Pseudomonas sp. PSKL.D1]WDY59604.1 GAD-like domain-containing protein [Pseudomonas sp. PSKL.D1]
MDEIFSTLIETIGASNSRREVPPSSIVRYENRLPSQLLRYWAEHGWCGYGDGLFWTVNPQEYEGVVASWIQGTHLEKRDTYHMIARSAFGDLYLFGEKTGFSLSIDSPLSRYIGNDIDIGAIGMDRAVQNFFLSVDKDANDFDELFEPANKKLGPLASDEMYGFVPALALGGKVDLKHLEKVKAIEHLILLSQITQLEPYSFSDF